jgi:hypothetical protein
VSARQQTRAQLRLEKYKTVNTTTTKVDMDNHTPDKSPEFTPVLPNKKRKYDNVTPELIRTSTDNLPDTKSNTIDSPEAVICASENTIHILDSPEALVWVRQPVCDGDQFSTHDNASPEPMEYADLPPLVSPSLAETTVFQSPTRALPLMHPQDSTSPPDIISCQKSSPKSPLPSSTNPPAQSHFTDTTPRCPCCNETMTVTHECDNIDNSDTSDDSIIHTPYHDSNTPAPAPRDPPMSSPDPSRQRPEAAPPDNGSTISQSDQPEINISRVLMGIYAMLSDRQESSECKTE